MQIFEVTIIFSCFIDLIDGFYFQHQAVLIGQGCLYVWLMLVILMALKSYIFCSALCLYEAMVLKRIVMFGWFDIGFCWWDIMILGEYVFRCNLWFFFVPLIGGFKSVNVEFRGFRESHKVLSWLYASLSFFHVNAYRTCKIDDWLMFWPSTKFMCLILSVSWVCRFPFLEWVTIEMTTGLQFWDLENVKRCRLFNCFFQREAIQ